MNPLQVRDKLAPRDPGNFRTDTAEILGLAASLDAVTNLHGFSADFALPSHLFDLETEPRKELCKAQGSRSISIQRSIATAKGATGSFLWSQTGIRTLNRPPTHSLFPTAGRLGASLVLAVGWLIVANACGCSLIGSPLGSGSGKAVSAQETEEVFRRIREAQAQNAVLVQVIGDSPPLRVLPLPPGQQPAFVSSLLKQTGVQEKWGRIQVRVFRVAPGVPAGVPMEVKFDPKTGQVRPECDYALRPGDRVQIAEDDSILEGFLDRWLPTSPQ